MNKYKELYDKVNKLDDAFVELMKIYNKYDYDSLFTKWIIRIAIEISVLKLKIENELKENDKNE